MSETKKSLVVIPNTDVGKYTHIFENHSDYGDVNVIRYNELNSSTVGIDSLGIVLSSPDQRLIRAYRATVAVDPKKYRSFREFYSEPTRLNFYNRLLKKHSVSQFGFVGLQEHLYRGVLMMSEWLDATLYRLPYHAFQTQSELVSIPEDDIKAIKKLHAKDFEIYENAKECFEARWQDYKALHELTAAPNKSIKIHLGPPKTGTSAIQAWLHENQQQLRSSYVLYPEHSSDRNGVSSGNFERLVSVDPSSGRPYFNDEKARQLANEFNFCECDTLLLSSEHFYYYAIWLFSRFPNAQYIFYIRHPLAINESGFHQEVKRHGRTKAFVIPSNIGFNSLAFIQSVAKEFSVHITYRFFEDSLFEGGSLLSDFSKAANIPLVAPDTVKRLNTQYSPGALKLMLVCNKFASAELRRDLDVVLQKDSESISAFTVVTKEQYRATQLKLKEDARRLSVREEHLNGVLMESLIESYKKPKTISDENALFDLQRVLNTLSKNEPKLSRRLYKELAQYKESDDECKNIQRSLSVKWYVKLWCLLGQCKW